MNVDTGDTRIIPAALGALLAMLCAVGGCGGSGSSGFDVSPLTESQAIATAIDNQQCVRRQDQVFCASGVEADRGDFEGANVKIQTPQEPLICDGESKTTERCVASLDFTTEGFESPNGLLAAVSESEAGPWTLAPLTVSEDVTGPRTVTISVPAETDDAERKPLIAAVLVYSGAPPADVPQTAAQLADFGTELVYVSPRLEVVIPR